MYSTCLFCHSALGANERLESFPIGRRLAFDGARGRLWVVCPSCRRWNLTPLEERWEAIEACERLFRATSRRVSTDNIGLAQLDDGMQLIRVGEPLRPEFAAWRYGGEFLRRRRRDLLTGASMAVGLPAGFVGSGLAAGALLGFGGAVAAPLFFVAGVLAIDRALSRRVVARARGANGETSLVRVRHLAAVRLVAGEADGSLRAYVTSDDAMVEVSDDAAAHLAAVACARRNQIGGTTSSVQAAVQRVEERGGPAGVVAAATAVGELRNMRYTERLALEMALHEEAERRALAGELQRLESAWREAEEIAALADNLLVPAPVDELLTKLRGGRRSGLMP
jgi:hypothetical protein